jgi:hypothetical protein
MFARPVSLLGAPSKGMLLLRNFPAYRIGASVSVPLQRHFSAAVAPSDSEEQKEPKGLWNRLFGAQTVHAAPDYKNRWLMVLPAFATHICIGSPWAWSVMSAPLSREVGIVASSSMDWSLFETTIPMSLVFALQGISAAVAGKWQMRVGTRYAMATAACCFGGGLLLGSVGIATHQLWLIYLGYGILGGTGVGVAYTPPIQALIEWFPDRKGLASGLTIAGFGSGALLFTPATAKLRSLFAVPPEYAGNTESLAPILTDGKLMAGAQEVVYASANDLQKLGMDLAEGYYVAGTGNSGSAATLAVMGASYFVVLMASALTMKRPHQNYSPAGYVAPANPTVASNLNVTVDGVMKTPQFYLLGVTFFCLATSGMGIMSVAKPMMSDVFSSALPTVVTAAFASQYVMALAGGNLSGRLGYAMLSDKVGARTTFNLFTWGSIPLFLAVPYCVDAVINTGNLLPLGIFVGSTVAAIGSMGGVYAILPAYEASLFGTKYVGPIHGRFLLASSAAAMVGPSTLLWMRGRAEVDAMHDLVKQVDPAKFEQTFGAPVTSASSLMESKVLTISKLLELAPRQLADPTPYLYNTAIYSMAGLMLVGAISHSLIRPVAAKHFVQDEPAALEETKK